MTADRVEVFCDSDEHAPREWVLDTVARDEVAGAQRTRPAPVGDAGGASPAAELLGLAARIYTASPAQRAALADQVIACAVALGGTPEATPGADVFTHAGG
jgi:hypothetical protein